MKNDNIIWIILGLLIVGGAVTMALSHSATTVQPKITLVPQQEVDNAKLSTQLNNTAQQNAALQSAVMESNMNQPTVNPANALSNLGFSLSNFLSNQYGS